MQTDFLVIGSGIAGLTFALKAAQRFPDKKVLVITKTQADETNTKYAQGEDTLISGDGLCNKQVVEIVVKEGVDRIQELIDWGAQFDKESDGDYKLGREGGHSEFRILHHKDVTGREMERAMLEAARQLPNIEIVKHCYVVDLLTQHHLGYLVTKSTPHIECYGVYVLNLKTNQMEKILANITVLASGGNGQVYRSTTNPNIATGDGIAMVYRAKGRIENMEFIQFHPTALYEPGVPGQSFLISEAVRGDGGILRNKNGEAFMERYDPRKDLAPRDIAARAIDSEMKITGTEHVYLDVTHIPIDKFIEHFPNIYEKCQSIGIDVATQYIPVAPAAHYSCGGIKTDEWGRTSIKNLYAAGECASTGLHGANRLASNSLLEAMVFAHRSFVDAAERIKAPSQPSPMEEESGNGISSPSIGGGRVEAAIPGWKATGTTQPKEMILITQSLKELQQVMSDYVGIVRTNIRLERAAKRLDLLWEETEALYQTTALSPQLCELRNMITVGYLIVKCAQFRKESRGLHFNTDYPYKSALVQNIVL
jgi:L-aspartate oxidase